jgi:hypothetical protein
MSLAEKLKAVVQKVETIDTKALDIIHRLENSEPVHFIEQHIPGAAAWIEKLGGPQSVLAEVASAAPQIELALTAFDLLSTFGKPADGDELARLQELKGQDG